MFHIINYKIYLLRNCILNLEVNTTSLSFQGQLTSKVGHRNILMIFEEDWFCNKKKNDQLMTL